MVICTHLGTRMNTHTHIPMGSPSILPQVRKIPGADAGLRTLTWTKCEARSNSSCATGVRKYVRRPPRVINIRLKHNPSKTQGKEEREASYKPIKEALLDHFSDIPMEERYGASQILARVLSKPNPDITSVFSFQVQVLVGSRMTLLGLVGSSVCSFISVTDSLSGFSCQGNEFSHYMLLASFFVLNRYASDMTTSAPFPDSDSTKDTASSPAHDLSLRPHPL